MSTKRKLFVRRYAPTWFGPIEGFTVNFLKKNFWRVQSNMEYEDCMQEAKLVFYKLVNKYPAIDTPQHFMALYKTSLLNAFTDLAIDASKFRMEVVVGETADDDTDDQLQEQAGELDNDGALSVMLQQAPAEVKQVLHLFMSAPVEILDMFSETWHRKGKYKDCGNEHLCAALGLPAKTNVVGLVSDYLK